MAEGNLPSCSFSAVCAHAGEGTRRIAFFSVCRVSAPTSLANKQTAEQTCGTRRIGGIPSFTYQRPTDGRTDECGRAEESAPPPTPNRHLARRPPAHGPPRASRSLSVGRTDGRRTRSRQGRRRRDVESPLPPWLNATSTRRNSPASTGQQALRGEQTVPISTAHDIYLHRFVVRDRHTATPPIIASKSSKSLKQQRKNPLAHRGLSGEGF